MDSIKIPPFEDGGFWDNPANMGEWWRRFRVGACEGLWRDSGFAYEILAIANDVPGNGHVEATLAHFYKSCKRDKKVLVIREVLNESLRDKLIKNGFTCKQKDDYIRRF